MNTVRVGVIGVGHLGVHHARVYTEILGTRLVGVMDVDEAHAHDVAENLGVPAYTDLDRFLDETKPDALSIVVPTVKHLEVAKKAMERNIHLLIEKPVTASTEEAEELLNMHQRLLGAAGDSTMLICSETGWKHAGESVSAAVPSFENAARYLEDVYALSRKEDIEIIYFAALEEKWKNKYDDGYCHLINQELEPMSYAQAALNRIAEERGEAAP